MSSSPIISVRVGGQVYRVQSTASSEDLARYATKLDERLRQLPKSQQSDPKSIVLVALGLVHDLEHLQHDYDQSQQATESRLRSLLARVDLALQGSDEEGVPLPDPPVSAQ